MMIDTSLNRSLPRPFVRAQKTSATRFACKLPGRVGSRVPSPKPSVVVEKGMQRHRMWRTEAAAVPGAELASGYGRADWQLVPLTNAVSQPVDVPATGVSLGGSSANAIRIETALNDSLEAARLSIRSGSVILTDVGKDTEVQERKLAPGEQVVLHDGERVVVGGAAFLVRWLGSGSPPDASEAEAFVASQRASGSVVSGGVTSAAVDIGHWAVSLGILYIANKLLAQSTAAAGISFPAPLIGMFGIIVVLYILTAAAKPASENIQAFFQPALDWIARWLPLFYVGPLVVLPLAVEGIPGASLAKMLLVIAVGMPASLFVTAFLATSIRKIVNTELEPTEPSPPAKPFTKYHHAFWSAVLVTSVLGAAFGPTSKVELLHRPALIAATVEGLLLGEALPQQLKTFVHPLITCSLFANLGAFVYAKAAGWAYKDSLRAYITKGNGMLGAGDYLMSFLGVVILTFGFRIFGQRRLMKRHAPEIFGSTTVSAAFSLFATAAFAKAIGLSAEIARALAPRSVTVALALPIAAQLGAPSSIAAAGVALTGLIGSNCVQALLNALGYKDPITRGLATAGASHGLGTAALAGKEPEALPFCALAYALIGIISTVLITIPPVRGALLALTA